MDNNQTSVARSAEMILKKVAVNNLAATIQNTILWITNLEQEFGQDAVLDQMPNNFGGRVELERQLAALSQEAMEPGGAGYPPTPTRETIERLTG